MNEDKIKTRLYDLTFKAKMLEKMINRSKSLDEKKELRKELESTRNKLVQTRQLLTKVKRHNLTIEERRGGKGK